MSYQWSENDLKQDFYISQDPYSNNMDLKRLVHQLTEDKYQVVISSRINSEFSKKELLDYLNQKAYYPWKEK